MQCQWNTERISHCHQGSQYKESRYTKSWGILTEARHGARVKLPLQIYPCQPMQCQWNKERLSHRHQGSQHCIPITPDTVCVSRYSLNSGVSPQRQDTGCMSSYRFRYTPASPCNASGTRSACPTATRVASISFSPIKGQDNRGTSRNGNNIMTETKYKR